MLPYVHNEENEAPERHFTVAQVHWWLPAANTHHATTPPRHPTTPPCGSPRRVGGRRGRCNGFHHHCQFLAPPPPHPAACGTTRGSSLVGIAPSIPALSHFLGLLLLRDPERSSFLSPHLMLVSQFSAPGLALNAFPHSATAPASASDPRPNTTAACTAAAPFQFTPGASLSSTRLDPLFPSPLPPQSQCPAARP